MIKDLRFFIHLFLLFTRNFRKKIALGFFLTFIFMAFSLSTPFLTRFLLDKVLLGRNEKMLTTLLLVMVGILIVFAVTDFIGNYILFVVFQKIGRNMRFDFFKKLQQLSADFFTETKTGDIVYRLFNDTKVIEESFSAKPINFILDIIFLVGISWIMFHWSWQLTLFVLFVFLFQTIVIIKFQNPLYKYSQMTKKESERLMSFTIEQISKIELAKVSNSVPYVQDRFLDKLNYLMKLSIRYFVLNKFSDGSVSLINNIWSFAILWYGGIAVIRGNLTIGTMMGFLLLAGMLFPPISRITTTFLGFQNTRASLKRFKEYYHRTPSVIEKEGSIHLTDIQGDICFQHVSFGYNPQHLVLQDINFCIRSGRILALIGKSGSGKTTICRLLLRFYDPASGSIIVNGHDLRDIHLDSYRSKIGVFLQNQFVFSGTIAENIAYGISDCPMEEIKKASRLANAHEFIMELPDGYNTEVGENGVKLSSGEAQRIALGRIFMKKPKLVILDEPTSFVDVNTEEKIKEAIFRLRQEASLLLIAHRFSTVRLADDIILVDSGKIRLLSKEEVLSNETAFSGLFIEESKR